LGPLGGEAKPVDLPRSSQSMKKASWTSLRTIIAAYRLLNQYRDPRRLSAASVPKIAKRYNAYDILPRQEWSVAARLKRRRLMASFAIPQKRSASSTTPRTQTSRLGSANAGSGKTYVLASRVVRLLLQGVAPRKSLPDLHQAAAANMLRVSSISCRWTQLADDELIGEIVAAERCAGQRG